MRFKILTVAIAAVFGLLIHSCSNDYSDNVANTLNSLVLTVNVEGNVIGVGQSVTFTVEGNDSNDYTNQSEIYANNSSINGSDYLFTEVGEVTFHATYNGLTSNSLVFSAVDQNYVTISHTQILREQTVTFGYYDVSGTDLTEEAIFYVNGNAISGNTFSSPQAGDFEVYADYEGLISESQSFSVFIPRKKVALDDYTGTWCGWCPRVLNVVDLIEDETDDVVVMAIHVNDEMQFPDYQQLFDYFNISTALPRLYLDRSENVTVLSDNDIPGAVAAFLDEAGSPISTSIAINTTLVDNNLSVTVKLLSEEAIPASNKLVVYLYQDGLIYDQTNYYNNIEGSIWYQMGNPIPDFVHNHVLEASITNIFGNNVTATPAFEEYSVSFNPINLSTYGHTDNGNTFDPSRFGIAVYLVDENSHSINAQKVKAGESVGFE